MPQSTLVCLQTLHLFSPHYSFDRLSCVFSHRLLQFFVIPDQLSFTVLCFPTDFNQEDAWKFLDKLISTPHDICFAQPTVSTGLFCHEDSLLQIVLLSITSKSFNFRDQKIIIHSIRLIVGSCHFEKF